MSGNRVLITMLCSLNVLACSDGNATGLFGQSGADGASTTTSSASGGSGATGSGATGSGTSGNGNGGSGGAGSGENATASVTSSSSGAGGMASTTYGYLPTTVDMGDASASYTAWKSEFVEDCGNGSYRVRWDYPAQTVSEGIGYGMLLAAYHDDKAVFDGLWSYYQMNTDPQGLMHWKVWGCDNNVAEENAASDADLDAALALLVVGCKWGGNYQQDGETLIAAIKSHEIETGCASPAPDVVLRPGDAWGGCDQTNPSYFSPAYYRVFAEVTGDSFWDTLADASYTTLLLNAHPSTGLVSDWCSASGAVVGNDNYFYDAARTPWRFAVDYHWWGTADAQSWLSTVTNWVNNGGGGIANIGDGYNRNGYQWSYNHNSTFVGGFATGAMAVSQSDVNDFASHLAGINDSGYFNLTLRALYLTTLAGAFNKPTCYSP